MTTAKERVEREKNDLAKKIRALTAFIFNDSASTVSKEMLYLLKQQLGIMQEYYNVLCERLQIWQD